jgi:hypothetical protein
MASESWMCQDFVKKSPPRKWQRLAGDLCFLFWCWCDVHNLQENQRQKKRWIIKAHGCRDSRIPFRTLVGGVRCAHKLVHTHLIYYPGVYISWCNTHIYLLFLFLIVHSSVANGNISAYNTRKKYSEKKDIKRHKKNQKKTVICYIFRIMPLISSWL